VLPRELVPEHYQDPHILGWYRPPGGFRKNLASLFRLHNETGNVWSHLIGFIIFVCLTAATVHLKPAPLRLGAEALVRLEHKLVAYGKSNVLELLQAVEAWEQRVVRYGQGQLGALEDRLGALEEHVARIGRENLQELSQLGDRIRSYGASAGAELAAELSAVEAAVHDALAAALEVRWPVSRWPIYVFTAGAMVCLLTSAVCHLFGCCAAHVTAVLWRFDYAGIAVLIVASFFPPVYYGFLCSPWTRLSYLIITSLLGLSTLCVTLLSQFQKTEWQTYRALLFVALGLWGLVPGLHAWLDNAGERAFTQALALDLLMGAIYIGGAAIYATRFPERWKPGAFDVAFHSHQLFHVAVVVAACVHYKAVRVLLAWRDATGGCLPPLESMSVPPGAAAPMLA
jgi:adiponectin receptor